MSGAAEVPDDERVLYVMSGDLTASEWGNRLNMTAPEVETFCRDAGLPLRRSVGLSLYFAMDVIRQTCGLTWFDVAKQTKVPVKGLMGLAHDPTPTHVKYVRRWVAKWNRRLMEGA